MGQNLILNMNDHGFVVCAYNRTTEKVDQFLANEAKGTKVIGARSLEEMVQKLKKPRRVMMLVKGESLFANLLLSNSWSSTDFPRKKNYFFTQCHHISE